MTGASGFIGSHLCRRLSAGGAEVYGLSRSSAPRHTRGAHGRPRARFHDIRVDLADAEATQTVFESVRPNVVFHLASHVSGGRELDLVATTLRDNLLTTVNVLTSASRCGRPLVLLAGSKDQVDGGSTHRVAGSPYSAAKTAGLVYARMFHALYDLPVVNLRTFMVYGPGQHDESKLIPYVTTSLLRDEVPAVTSGVRLVDWVYIDDVVDAYVAAAESQRAPGHTVAVGSGQLASIRTVVEQLVAATDTSARPDFGAVPDRVLEDGRAADVAETYDLIGWQPRVSLADGLHRTVQWFRERESA